MAQIEPFWLTKKNGFDFHLVDKTLKVGASSG